MRALTLGLTALLSLSLAAASPAHAAKHTAKPSCAKKGSKTLRRGSGVRVFTAAAKSDGEQVTRLYGCLSANGRKQVLSERSDNGEATSGFEDVRLAGHYVGWHSFATDSSCKADCPPDLNQRRGSMIAFDLKRRRISRRFILAGPTGPSIDYTRASLALTQRGGLAWLSPGTPGPQQLNVADAGGRRILDAGNIAAASVKAEISIVSWVHDGVERFARLR
jgi:hypothetical protein